MDHSTRARALAQLTVLPQLYRNIPNIHIRVHEWSNRRIGVERFAAAKLLLLFLQIAIGDVEADSITENVMVRFCGADVLCPRADHYSQLNFKDRKSTRLNSSHITISYAVF